MSDGTAFKYWAFISYSHRDKRWGDWLHRALETYRVPKRLVGTEGRDGPVPRRIYPVFRDREELPTATDLGEVINEALRRSRYLVVICSPRSATSKWVNEEVLAFKRMGRSDRILCLIVDGEPNASDKPDLASEECFPRAIRLEVSEDGAITERRTEPIAADAREGKDGKGDARLKLIAGVLSVGFDQLKQRELQRRQRRLLALSATMTAIALVMGALTAWALMAQDEATRQRVLSDRRLVRHYAREGVRLMDAEDPAGALSWLVEAAAVAEDDDAAEGLRVLIASVMQSCPWVQAVVMHDDHISSAAFSPDGAQIATVSWDETLRVWETATGTGVTAPMKCQHGAPLGPIRFTPDGQRLVTDEGFPSESVWDVKSERAAPYALLPEDGVLHGATFSPDADLLVTPREDNAVVVWDVARRRLVTPPMQHSELVSSVSFSADGKSIASVSGRTVHVWDLMTATRRAIVTDEDDVQSASLNADGRRVATVSSEGARVWDATTGEPLMPFVGRDTDVVSARLGPRDELLLTWGGSTARVWRITDGEPTTPPLRHEGQVHHAAFAPDGTAVITTGGDDQTARVWSSGAVGRWESSSRDRGKMLDEWNALAVLHHNDAVRNASFGPGGRFIVTTGSTEARVWRTDEFLGESPWERRISLAQPGHFPGQSHRVTFSPDGLSILTWFSWHHSLDGPSRVWSVASGALRTPQVDHCRDARFSPDGRLFVTVGRDEARVRDATTGESVGPTLRHDGAQLFHASISADGTRAVTSGVDGARVWSVATGMQVGSRLPHLNGAEIAAFSVDGAFIVTAGGAAARVWSVATGDPVTPRMEHEDGIGHVSFSPDGKHVLTASDWGTTARVWDAMTGEPISRPLPHRGRILHASFRPDGMQVLTTSEDGAARTWSVATGEPTAAPFRHADSVTHASYSPDGRWIATASADQTARVWDAATGLPIIMPVRLAGNVEFAGFGPDGKRLLAASAYRAVVLDLTPTARSIEELVALAECVSGRRIDATGALVPIPASGLIERINEAKAKYPHLFSAR